MHEAVEAPDLLLRVDPVQPEVVLEQGMQFARPLRLLPHRETSVSGGGGNGIQCVGSQGTPPAVRHPVSSQ